MRKTNKLLAEFLQLFLKTAVFLCLLLAAAGCKEKPRKAAPAPVKAAPAKEVTVSVVVDESMSSFLKPIQEGFDATNPRLADGSRVKIRLIEERGVDAAEKLASGKLKVDAWLAPSESLVNYANENIRNLGAKQVDCRELFGTPIVAAANQASREGLATGKSEIDLREAFEKGTSDLIINHLLPTASQAGLAAYMQLFYTAQEQNENLLTQAAAASQEVTDRLKSFERRASRYGIDPDQLLQRVAAGDSPGIALVSEQQVAEYNLKQAGKTRLAALYPTIGSYWLSYSLCRSEADWVTPSREAGLKLLTAYLTSERVQNAALQRGYRPVRVDVLGAPFTAENGLDPEFPKKLLRPVSGVLMKQLLQTWSRIEPPLAIALLADVSGSMEGTSLPVEQQQFDQIVRDMSGQDSAALIAFSTNAEVKTGFTSDKSALEARIGELQAAGGSAVYDALGLALQLFSQAQLPDHRKSILLVTDGNDGNSAMSMPLLLGMLPNTVRQQHINLTIVAIKDKGFDPRPFKELAAAAGGSYYEATRENLYDVFAKAVPNLG